MKIITKSISFLLSAAGVFSATRALAQAKCFVNNAEAPCGNLGQVAALGLGLIALIAFIFVLGIGLFVFWIMMIVHASSNPIDNRAVWIIIMVFFHGLGAIVYYFSVKRPYDKAKKSFPIIPGASVPPPPPPPSSPT